MANTTNVPTVTFTPTGLVIPTTADILAGVQADQAAAFGGNLNPALNTPQGQLATSTTAIIAASNDEFATFVNQVDPDFADGFMQDAIGRIYFLDRIPGTPTAVQCQCVGLFGTAIPLGAQAQDTSGNIYVCTEAGTIGVGGTVTLSFANIALGPTPCPANTLTTIYQAIPGWESINNSADGIVGANVESRAEFEYRRQQSVALNAQGSPQAIYARVFDVANVIDVYVQDNDTGSTVNYGSTAYPIPAHCVYVAVVGGAALDVATAIFNAKNLGCATVGNTTETVTDQSGYSIPYPTYSISFNVPTATPILFAVEIANVPTLPADIINLTKNAIVAAFNGTDGSQRVRIGSLILASKFYAPVSAIGPEVSILSILLGPSTPTLTNYQAGIDQAPTITAANVAVSLV